MNTNRLRKIYNLKRLLEQKKEKSERLQREINDLEVKISRYEEEEKLGLPDHKDREVKKTPESLETDSSKESSTSNSENSYPQLAKAKESKIREQRLERVGSTPPNPVTQTSNSLPKAYSGMSTNFGN